MKEKSKEKHYYDVKIETMIPATIIFRILAEDPEQAVELVKYHNPIDIKYQLRHKRDKKISVYDAGTVLLKFIKNIIGN